MNENETHDLEDNENIEHDCYVHADGRANCQYPGCINVDDNGQECKCCHCDGHEWHMDQGLECCKKCLIAKEDV